MHDNYATINVKGGSKLTGVRMLVGQQYMVQMTEKPNVQYSIINIEEWF